MHELNGSISPTIQTVADKIKGIISKTIEDHNSLVQSTSKIITSHIEEICADDSWTCTISMVSSNDIATEKVLNFIVIQDIKSRNIAIAITTGEIEGFKILYKSINRYPLVGIEKYLPNIVSSSIAILIRNNI